LRGSCDADVGGTEPLSRQFGVDRGQPIDRYYIEAFLAAHAADICGRVIEVGDTTYSLRFGGAQVREAAVLLPPPGGPHATVVADLESGVGVPEGRYDCAIVTQTLHVLYGIHAAVRHCRTMLRPGGVLLATIPCITQVSRYDMDRWGDYWRLTDRATERLFAEAFGADAVDVQGYGNFFAACAFLRGLAVEDISPALLDDPDPDYHILTGVRALAPLVTA